MNPASNGTRKFGAALLFLLVVVGSLIPLTDLQAQNRVRYIVEPVDAGPAVSHQDLLNRVATVDGQIFADVDYPQVNGNLVGVALTPQDFQNLANDPNLRVVPDTEIQPDGGGLPWTLDRIDQRLATDGAFLPPFLPDCAQRPFVYLCDTGIEAGHDEFALAGPRINFANSYISTGLARLIPAWQDPWDHGTAVAGCAVGETLGTARCPVNLVSAVCYPDPTGMPPTSFVSHAIDTIYWSLNDHNLRQLDGDPNNDASILIFASSTTGGPNALLDLAVQRAFLGGMTVLVSAGNQNQDAMMTSPAGAISATNGDITMTVAASDMADLRWAGSNYGARVELFAPGDGAIVPSSLGPSVCHVRSGTSLSVGYAAGVAARVHSRNPLATAPQVYNFLTDHSDPVHGPSGPFGGMGINSVPTLLYQHPTEYPCIGLSYSEWLILKDATGVVVTPDGDADCDCLQNGVEYLMGLEPLARVKKEDRPSVTMRGNTIRYRFRLANYVCEPIWAVEFSTDLANWHAVPHDLITPDGSDCTPIATWLVAKIPAPDEGRIYVRLRITGI